MACVEVFVKGSFVNNDDRALIFKSIDLVYCIFSTFVDKNNLGFDAIYGNCFLLTNVDKNGTTDRYIRATGK